MAQSLTKSSASLVAAGGNLAEAAALTATANAIIQDADSVGTALKTTSLRLRGTKVEVLEEEGLDSDGAIESTSKLRSQILATSGVDILTDSGAYKSTYQILLEIAEVWDKITDDKARAGLLELMAGKQNSSVIAALLQNPEDLKAAYKDAMNAEGSALKENEKYLDSIQGKIDQFNNSVQAMWSNTLDSDVIKNFVSLGTTLVQTIDKIGVLNIALVGLYAFLAKKAGFFDNIFKPAADGIDLLRKQLAEAEANLAKAETKNATKNTAKTFKAKESAEKRVNNIKEKIKPYDDVDRLRQQREELLGKQVEARQKIESSKTDEEAKKDLAKINEQLAQTNKELVKAEANLAAIDKKFTPLSADSLAIETLDPEQTKKNITNKKRSRTRRINKLQKEGKSFDEISADPKVQQYTKDIEEAESALNRYNEVVKSSAASNREKAASEVLDAAATNGGTIADKESAAVKELKNASTLKEFIMTAMSTGAKAADIKEAGKQILMDKIRNSWLIKNAIAQGVLTTTEAASAPITTLLSAGVKGLAVSFGELWASIWPVALILLAIAAAIAIVVAEFYGIIKLVDFLIVTSKELREELSGLKEELADIQSQIESLEDELETTQKRMAELLAKDSLSFTEQEELEALQKQNDELEREIYLLEQREKRLQLQAQHTFDDLMKKNLKEKDLDGDGENDVYDKSLEDKIKEYEEALKNEEKVRQELLEAKRNGDEEKIKEKEDELRKKEETTDKKKAKVDKKLNQYLEDAEGIDYASADDETKKYLDYIYNTEGKVNVLNGEDQAKTVEIKRIFNKKEYDGVSDTIDNLVEKLKDDPKDATFISQIRKQCAAAEKDLMAVGLSVQDATDYFTKLGMNASFDTLEGKIAEVSKAATNFESLLKGGSFRVDEVDTGLADLFDEEGKIIQTKLSQVFQGTSDQTREEITKLLESSYGMIADGLDDAEIKYLMNRIGLSFSAAILEIEKTNLATKNLELFPGLEDEISGIIDTFSELTSAVGSVVDAMDALNQAQVEEAYSGSVSLETLEQLMKSTDNYADLIEVDETGAIHLATNAQEILVKQKLEAIKTNAELALKDAELAYEEALHTEQTYSQTGPAQEYMRSLWNEVGGVMSFVGSLWGDLTSGNWDGAWDRARQAQKDSITTEETKYATKAAEASAAVAEAAKKLENAEKMNKVAQGLTEENVKQRFSSDEASGGNDDMEDLIADGWEKLISKYENELALITNERDLIQAEIDNMEAQGGKASAQYYKDLIRNSSEEQELLEKKLVALQEYLDANKDSIDKDTWTEYNNEINATAVAIKECAANTLEWEEALREIDKHYFDQATDEISRLGEELEFIDSLLEDEDVADENGNWSSEALTRMGMYIQQMELAAAQAARYKERIAELDEQRASGELSEEQYQEALSEAVSEQQNAIQSYEDAKDSIVELNEARVDAIKSGIEKEIEAYEDLINAKKKELEAERDLFDFRKNVNKQNKDISELERRISALSGSTAASDIAERRKLEQQLTEAKEGLNDTYYDHSRTAQDTALDAEQEAYTLSKEKYIEKLEEQLKDTETLIENSIMDVLFNADTVYTELNELADLYGFDLSDSLTQPWKDASAQAIAWKDELAKALSASELDLITHENGAVTAFSNGVATKIEGTWARVQTAAENYAGYLTSSELSNGFSKALTGFGNQIQGIIDKWNGVKTAADAAYEAQKRVATVGGDENVEEVPDPPDLPENNNAPKKNNNYSVNSDIFEDSDFFKIYGILNRQVLDLGYGPISLSAFENKLRNFEIALTSTGVRRTTHSEQKNKIILGAVSGPMAIRKHAKGTTGTKRDEWAITDESWIGEEITLAAGKNGRLRGMMKGSAVLPSNISENLVEWGKLSPDEMHSGNVVNNYVNAPTNDVDVANSLTIDGKSSNTQGVHDSIRDTYELIEDTVKNIHSVSQQYKPFIDEALTTPWIDATEKTNEFNAVVNANYDDVVSHIDENKEPLEIALSTPYANTTGGIDDFSQHAQKTSVDDIITHANEKSSTLTTALSAGFNNAKAATDALKNSGTNAVDAVKDSFTNTKTGLIKVLNDTTTAANKTKQAIDNVPTYSSGSSASVQAGQHYISSLGKNVTLSSNVTKWGSVATQALQKTGQYSYDNLLLLLYQMQTESSGNQNAINNWDSNAKNGTPSKGLMQVIDPTFQAYAMNGYDEDIYDPLSNIIASIRYTTSRYGSLSKGWSGSGYATGTTGTSKDEWALTDEPQFGDELVLIPTPQGNLSYMRKGTGVVPAKLTEELMELGKIGVDGLMGANKFGADINMISSAINKPEITIDVENFLKVDRVDKDTLPQLEAMMDKKIDTFAKQLNYSIKKFSR